MPMLRARRRFLVGGAHERLSNRINEHIARHLANRLEEEPGRGCNVLDVGCGEGYYLGRLHEHVVATNCSASWSSGAGTHCCLFGLDISRDALRLAARRFAGVHFFVNDVQHRICMATSSADVVLNVFAPRNAAEFARVLRTDGLLIVVIPRERHLDALAAALPLLDIDADKLERTIAQFSGSFEPVTVDELEYACSLTGDFLADLVQMSPSYHHVGESGVAQARGLGRMDVTLRFSVLCLSKLR